MRALLIGAGLAAAAGMTMGSVLHPDLRSDDRPEGPQILALAGGPRSAGAFDSGMSMASYGATPPDYVIGTDAKTTMARAEHPAPVEEPDEMPSLEPEWERAPLARATYEEAPDLEPDYPSLRGGRAYDPPPEAAQVSAYPDDEDIEPSFIG